MTRSGDDTWLLEHVWIDHRPVIGPLMDLLNSMVVRMIGANINQTVENVKQAGLTIINVENLKGELVKLTHAQP